MNQTSPNPSLQPASYLFEHFGSPASICTNQTLINTCDTLKIGDYVIMSPELLPCCLMALILGFTFAHKILKTKSKNSVFHAMTFAMIGVMMTDAGWNDCLLPNLFVGNKFIHNYYEIIDVGLTSTIGFAFLINGLLDAGTLKQNSPVTWAIFGVGTLGIFVAWTFTTVKASVIGVLVLYMGIVGVGCGTWTVIQLKLVIEEKDWTSLKWLIFAGLHGGFGFYSILSVRLRTWLCENVSCHVATNFIWFIVTDTAMYFIYRYYKSRAKFQPEQKRLIEGDRLSLAWF